MPGQRSWGCSMPAVGRCTPRSPAAKTRWVVERTSTWLHQFKRLRIRYEIRADLHIGLRQLACSIIC
ncbi:transposase [Streptomyces achromogenes]|uniref:Transposase n=1 Tax=Streptomyces achromogenes TaxID=67255 RepID=A0ABU0QDX1_STRAH|nr:transposase [Streptomyces achromogenes]MDQ0836014.1 transposase [Streptomyces achromogenes]